MDEIKITKKDLFQAFSYYAFLAISQQPYSQDELVIEFDKWYEKKYPIKQDTADLPV